MAMSFKFDPNRRCKRVADWPASDRALWTAALLSGDVWMMVVLGRGTPILRTIILPRTTADISLGWRTMDCSIYCRVRLTALSLVACATSSLIWKKPVTPPRPC